MSKPKSIEVIVLKESLAQSIVSDIVTFVTIFAVIGAGRWIDSPVMQIFGVAMLCLAALGRAAGRPRLSVPEARDRLDAIEKGTKS